MTEISINKLKLNRICPALNKNNWEYSSNSKELELMKTFINIAICWLSRRGKHISLDALRANLYKKFTNNNPIFLTRIDMNIRQFYKDHYLKLINPLSQQKLEIEFESGIVYTQVPIIEQSKNPIFIFLQETESKLEFIKSLEVRLTALWAALQRVNNYTIKNIYPTKKIEDIIFKPTGKYIENCRMVIKSMLESRAKTYPPEEICKGCQNLKYCLV